MAKQKLLKNAPLETGDRVVCLKMQDDYGVPGGIPGIVKGVSNVFGENQYNVKWKNGSSLALIEGVDQWLKVVEEEENNESHDEESQDGIVSIFYYLLIFAPSAIL